jgi:hypothetical protein
MSVGLLSPCEKSNFRRALTCHEAVIGVIIMLVSSHVHWLRHLTTNCLGKCNFAVTYHYLQWLKPLSQRDAKSLFLANFGNGGPVELKLN